MKGDHVNTLDHEAKPMISIPILHSRYIYRYIAPSSLLVSNQAFYQLLETSWWTPPTNMKIFNFSAALLAVGVVAHPSNGMFKVWGKLVDGWLLIGDAVNSIVEPLTERAAAANGSVQYGMSSKFHIVLLKTLNFLRESVLVLHAIFTLNWAEHPGTIKTIVWEASEEWGALLPNTLERHFWLSLNYSKNRMSTRRPVALQEPKTLPNTPQIKPKQAAMLTYIIQPE